MTVTVTATAAIAAPRTTEEFAARGRELAQLATSITSKEDWEARWSTPQHAFGSYASECWNFSPTFRVPDFHAEFGALVDALGFEPMVVIEPGTSDTDDGAYAGGYAIFRSPALEVSFAVTGATQDRPAVDPRALVLEFMVDDVAAAFRTAVERGLEPVREPYHANGMERAALQLPSGIELSLWQIPTVS